MSMTRTSTVPAAFAGAFLAAASAAGGVAPSEDEVVVRVNGVPVLRSTVDRLLEPMRRAKLPREQIARHRRGAVQNLVTDILIEQFLKKENFTPTEAEIEAEVERLKKIYESSAKPGAPSFDEALRRVNMSVEKMKRIPPPRMRFSCCVRRDLPDEDVLRMYETGRESWTEVRARHILIATRDLNNKEEKDAALERAAALRGRVLAGEDFAALAKEHSSCSSKEKGGDLGFFPRRGKMVEPFAKAAFALEKGGVSRVVETRFGCHVIQVTDIRPAPAAPLSEVRERVVAAAAEKRGREIFGELMRTANIEQPGRKKR